MYIFFWIRVAAATRFPRLSLPGATAPRPIAMPKRHDVPVGMYLLAFAQAPVCDNTILVVEVHGRVHPRALSPVAGRAVPAVNGRAQHAPMVCIPKQIPRHGAVGLRKAQDLFGVRKNGVARGSVATAR